MKVLYDISALGIAQSNASSRAGIFRVVESVAEHLAAHKECDLQFCSTFLPRVLVDAVEYTEKKKEFRKVPFHKPSTFRKVRTSINRYKLIERINKKDITLSEKLPLKFQIKAMRVKEIFYNLLNKDGLSIDLADLSGMDIFHSPFLPIPDHIKRTGIRSMFLTSYDLIPLLFPQFAVAYTQELIINLLNSMDRETWVLCISEATRNDLLNHKGNTVDPDKVIVTELAASDNFYPSTDMELNRAVKKKYGIPEVPYILSLCTLEPRKNIDGAIRAFAKMVEQEKITDLNLVLVGAKGWMFDKIFEEIGAIAALKDRIIITGFVPDEDLAPIYSDALFFVYPTFYEGFGLPPLEAMKCGTPVITSNTSSLPEVVGDAGIMVAPTDGDALCAAMLSLYKSSALQQDLKQRSLVRAGRFSWERCAQETVNAYRESLA